jgi:UDP-glucose 4-epimerase
VHGDGTQTRCFTFVGDTVRGTLLAARSRDALGRVFNIGSDVETTLEDLARMIVDLTGSTSTIEHVSYEAVYGARFEDPASRRPDITRARTELGWEPEVPLQDGLRRTLAWWKTANG